MVLFDDLQLLLLSPFLVLPQSPPSTPLGSLPRFLYRAVRNSPRMKDGPAQELKAVAAHSINYLSFENIDRKEARCSISSCSAAFLRNSLESVVEHDHDKLHCNDLWSNSGSEEL